MRIVSAFLPSSLLIYICVAILVGWWAVMRMRRATGVWRLRYYALPRPWLKYVHAHVPLYDRLPWELRAPYQDKVLQFVDAKGFRACGAMDEVTEAMRVTIAGNACLLLLNGTGEVNYPEVLTVQVYPHGDPDAEARSSCVALHWDDAKKQATDPRDKGNAALPAIALKLGWETAGRPALPETLLLTAWARVRSTEFVKSNPGVLEQAVGSAPGNAVSILRGLHPSPSGYGERTAEDGRPGDKTGNPATDDRAAIFEPEDIFAVATEMFLAAPTLLQQQQPALYACMRRYYQVDPARWTLQQ